VLFVFELSSMDAIRFTFTPTHRDYVTAARAYLSRQQLYLLIVFLLGLVSGLTWLLFSLSANREDAFVFVLPALIMPFGLVVLFLIVTPIVMASQAAKNKTLTSELRWEASTAGLHVAGANTDTLLNWGLFKDVLETKSYFLLVFRDRRKLFQMIPKRAFATPEDQARFRELANMRIENVEN
jgi:hypothetical protein